MSRVTTYRILQTLPEPPETKDPEVNQWLRNVHRYMGMLSKQHNLLVDHITRQENTQDVLNALSISQSPPPRRS